MSLPRSLYADDYSGQRKPAQSTGLARGSLPDQMMMLLLIVLVQVFGGQALAHVGSRVFPIYEISDADLAIIDLYDVRTEDWFAVIGEPTATYDDLDWTTAEISPAPTGRDDFDFRVWLAWHRSGRIYGAVETVDDVFVNWNSTPSSCCLWDDTSVLFAVDADHGGEPYQSVCRSQPCFENLHPPIEASKGASA